MALRAGVAVADLEFAQFHPTVLALAEGDPFLISEAVRGEGAYLRDAGGQRFMLDRHPLAELAPRDVVARGIQRQMALDATDHVFLDLRHLDAGEMRTRFPTIARELSRRGLELATDSIPVAPAAHYFMGGIVAGPTGETSLPGLLALGEAACTGVHGANRLASNSLLEGLVFGLAAADRLAAGFSTDRVSAEGSFEFRQDWHAPHPEPIAGGTSAVVDELRGRLQRTMSRYVAVVRDAAGLEAATGELDEIAATIVGLPADDRSTRELRNMVLVARTIAMAARRRTESRGAHFRADFPERDPDLAGQHLILGGADAGWRFGTLSQALIGSLAAVR
jgi:L-aspartate oxidase